MVMVDFEEIKDKISEGQEIEEVLKKFNWKEFEDFITEIFRSNGFTVKQNFRFKTNSRHEIDLLAVRNKLVLCIDCKEWNRGRYKKTGLKYAARNQEKRLGELRKFLKKNPIATGILNVDANSNFYPLIVTLFEEDLTKERDTIVIPVWKLNLFLLEMDNYLH